MIFPQVERTVQLDESRPPLHHRSPLSQEIKLSNTVLFHGQSLYHGATFASYRLVQHHQAPDAAQGYAPLRVAEIPQP